MKSIIARSLTLSSCVLLLAACQGQQSPGAAEKPVEAPAEAPFDLPATCDGPGGLEADNEVILRSPEPMASRVSGPLTFEVDVPATVPHADVEQGIRVRTAGGAPVAGTFRWEARTKPGALRPDFVLTFTPEGGFAPDTDFTVSVSPHGAFQPSHAIRDLAPRDASGGFQTSFSTRTSPRVALVRVVSKDGKEAVYVHLKLSEPAPAAEVEASLAVTVGGVPVAGSLDLHAGLSAEYQYTFAKPVPIDQPLELSLAAQADGALAEPMAWDARTAAAGKVIVQVSEQTACPREQGCWEWRPAR